MRVTKRAVVREISASWQDAAPTGLFGAWNQQVPMLKPKMPPTGAACHAAFVRHAAGTMS
eukprot:141035-Chlamydomonas_euryale.AAC.17